MKYVDRSEGKSNHQSQINWKDFNYPICFKIFHFNSDQTPDTLTKRVLLLRINNWLIILANFWNFINNIVDAGQGVVLEGGLRVVISIFLFFTWLPASFYIFIIPYEIYMKQKAMACAYYVISMIVIVWYFLWSIADFADANGWVMVARCAQYQKGACTFFGVITSLLMMIISILALANMVMFYRRKDE